MALSEPPGSPKPLSPPGQPAAAERQLPVHRGKLNRIQDSVEGAVLGLREWIELKVELKRREIEETVKEKAEQAKWGGAAGATALVALLFLLTTIGFGLSALYRWLLGVAVLPALTLGFLTFVIILLIVAAVFLRLMRKAARTEIELEATDGQR